ncbi:EAL domain-containing protein [Neptunomonas sp. XY-337]|uniref:sensor domain-containing diguanylate cyclase n=1 Tax=Neptunomonas sp. XY-337 TaxID=2561897 RepID=UPI0010AACBA9|nr:EAL domain-containing protein [Neptunomonas sp. XY-337]
MIQISDERNEAILSVEELDHILQLQHALFPRVLDDADHIGIINDLCFAAEKLLPNSVASVMLLSEQSRLLNVLCGPSIPDSAKASLANLKPGPFGGSCGNAVHSNQPTFVTDTYTDKRWSDLRKVAVDFNICACWSMPIRNKSGDAIGSFALSSFEHRAPSEFHRRLLVVCASIASIVLERQTKELLLKKRNHQLRIMGNALKQAQELFLIIDAERKVIEASQAVEPLCGYSPQEIIGKPLSDVLAPCYSTYFIERIWSQLEATERWHGEVKIRNSESQELVQWLSISQTEQYDDDQPSYVAVFTDLSEIKRSREELVQALEYDQLTGLGNKGKLMLALEVAEPDASLLLLNLNGFSIVNTAYGIDFGDRLLIAIAAHLHQFASADRLYRINADEFALLLPKHADLEGQIISIRDYFASTTIDVDTLNFNVTFTYGGAANTNDLLSKSLQALRKAKRRGKHSYHLYDSDQDAPDQSQRMNHIEWGQKLHAAIAEDRIVPYFQGIQDNKLGTINHYEALVRLVDDEQIHSPFHFLPAAHIAGLLPTITRIMIDKSFAHIADMPVTLSLNITEADLNEHYLADYLAEKSEAYGVSPERITLEILESVSADGKKNHIKQLGALKARGYHLAIDDFGTEYSNFERILELQVEQLKIDAKYIRNITKDRTALEIVRAMVFFAKNTGIVTVAEYVSDADIQAVVESLGIELSQGYLFSEPAPAITR